MNDITMLSLAEVSSLLKEKKVSPVELVDAVLERTNKYQPELNAYITLLDDEAKADAKKMEAELMKGQKSPLHGVPVALKDIFYTKGVLTSAGSKVLSDFVPTYDGTVTERLRKAGAIMMGKTNLHEFAFGPTTEDSYYGPSKNPWDSTMITGGSSGGSAVAVATGMAYMAMGSDTGGSVRIPASMCGVVGFKPSFGLVSLYGIVPVSFNLDHPGPLTRSVMDAALTMDIIAGYDEKDTCPGKYKGELPPFAESIKGIDDLKGIVIGVPENFFFEKTDYAVEKNVREAIKSMEALGAKVKKITIPALSEVPRVSTSIMFAEAAYWHKDIFSKHRDVYAPSVRERIENGQKISAAEYIEALKERESIIDEWEKACQEVDVIVAPTEPITAYKIGSTRIMTRGKEEDARPMCILHTRLANMTGGPALSVPCGLTQEGLPVGLMIMGRNLDDVTVLKVGHVYEKFNAFTFPRGK